MLILLPKPSSSVDAVIQLLRKHPFGQLPGGFRETRGTLLLPRFKIEWGQKLNEALEAAGLVATLSCQGSFPNIVQRSLVSPPQLAHKAHVTVDEEGTEAAAVTTAGGFGSRGSMESPPPFEMIVNRPFLFAIDNVNLPGPLFLGRVEDPSKNR